MIGALDDAMKAGQAHQRDQSSNQIDIFAMLGTPAKGAKKAGRRLSAGDGMDVAGDAGVRKRSAGFLHYRSSSG